MIFPLNPIAAAQVCTEPMALLRLFAADGHAVVAATVSWRSSMTSQPGGLESGGVPRGPSSVFFSHVLREKLGPVHWRKIVSRDFFFRGAKSEESEWWWDSGESPRKVMV